MDRLLRRARNPLILLALVTAAAARRVPDMARWQAQAARVTITRDDWGIPHVRGRSDADAVFGMIYAQAEDDFARIEANYLTALGRTRGGGGRGGGLGRPAPAAVRRPGRAAGAICRQPGVAARR